MVQFERIRKITVTIDEQLTADMATSMKAGDTERTGVLRLLRSAMKNEQIKVGRELNGDEMLKVLQREAKQRRDSITAYREAGRDDLASTEEAELAVIVTYLPEPLGEAELVAIVDEVIAAQSASGMAAMGGVIGAVMAKVGARAEGGAVSKIVRERLSA
jgi:uncharacterized protein YqeY